MSLVSLCANGFWWCFDCERVRGVSVDGIATACESCGSYRVKWNDPVKGFAESLQFGQLASDGLTRSLRVEKIELANECAAK